ncbi:MAG TPA: O-antigen ligase family protein [Terriglobales bacterium]
MSETGSKGALILFAGGLLVLLVVLERPGYLTSPSALGGLIIAEVILAALTQYRKLFFPILVCSFLWAGIDLPFRGAFAQGRWIVLGIGAAAGLIIYLHDHHHYFSSFHLIAFFCILSAFVSSSVSAYPSEALLKALSLLMLLVYAATGARSVVSPLQPAVFFRKVLLACEAVTYITVILYFALRWEIFGNPNSLGAVVGVAIVPTLLWGYISADSNLRRWRSGGALSVAVLLLMSSFARAGIGAAALVFVLICFSLRQYRLLIQGTALAVVIAIAVIVLVPRESDSPYFQGSDQLTAAFIYKGNQDQGVFGSRRSVWTETWDSIRAHPWFGTGFGTSMTNDDMTKLDYAARHVGSRVAREHGNSYLAITEWTGVLGVLPFFLLVLFAVGYAAKVFRWVRRTGDVFSPAIPAASIVVAGAFHAMFEDWMFAVGYYLSVFFWSMAFILVDVMPRATVVQPQPAPIPLPQQFGVAMSGD